MANLNYHSHPYIRQLNDYQVRLLSCLELSVFLMGCVEEKGAEEWHKAACWLMCDQLKVLGEQLPFPNEGVLVLGSEVV